jgi:hypothetical protein
VVAGTVKYFITGAVKVEATDGYAKYGYPTVDTGEFSIYRPVGCTNEGITVNFTLSGTALNDVDYDSSASGSVWLQAGETTAFVTITPKKDFDASDESVVLTLTSGSGLLYPIGTPPADSATVTIKCLTDADTLTHYVNKDSTAPDWPYTNWVHAATNIQDAIDAAGPLSREVVVTNGTYDTGGTSDARILIGKSITVRSVNGPGATIIRGQINANMRCVMMTVSGTVLDGFTLTGGGGPGVYNGGGVFCEGWDTTGHVIANCIIVSNYVNYTGGGAYGGTFYNCTLSSNKSDYAGGGATATMPMRPRLSTTVAAPPPVVVITATRAGCG